MPSADYFGALMRSGGLLQPVRARGADRQAAAVQETVAETVAVPVALQPPRGLDPSPIRPPVVDAHRVMPAGSHPPEAVAAAGPTIDQDQRVMPAERALAPEPARPQPDAARGVVRTVMQWIAADPHAGPPAEPVQVKAAAPTAATDETRTAPATPPRAAAPPQRTGTEPAGDRDRDEATWHVLAPSPARTEAPAELAWPATRLAMPVARPVASVPPEPHSTEPLTVTIGAIHLRVDAPAVQTVAQPAAPASRPMPERNPKRSGLSRRALRRV